MFPQFKLIRVLIFLSWGFFSSNCFALDDVIVTTSYSSLSEALSTCQSETSAIFATLNTVKSASSYYDKIYNNCYLYSSGYVTSYRKNVWVNAVGAEQYDEITQLFSNTYSLLDCSEKLGEVIQSESLYGAINPTVSENGCEFVISTNLNLSCYVYLDDDGSDLQQMYCQADYVGTGNFSPSGSTNSSPGGGTGGTGTTKTTSFSSGGGTSTTTGPSTTITNPDTSTTTKTTEVATDSTGTNTNIDNGPTVVTVVKDGGLTTTTTTTTYTTNNVDNSISTTVTRVTVIQSGDSTTTTLDGTTTTETSIPGSTVGGSDSTTVTETDSSGIVTSETTTSDTLGDDGTEPEAEEGDPTSYGNADWTSFNSTVENLALSPSVSIVEGQYIVNGFTFGQTGVCDNLNFSFFVLGNKINPDVCFYVEKIQILLYWTFAILTFLYIHDTWKTSMRGRS